MVCCSVSNIETSMNPEHIYRFIGTVVVTVVVAFGVASLIQLIAKSPLWSAEGAAWVQAIGSIAAIYGAFRIANQQLKHQRQSERKKAAEERLRVSIIAEGLVSHSLVTLKNLIRSIDKWPYGSAFKYHEMGRIDSCIQTLRTLMAQPLPSDVVKIILQIYATLIEADAAAKGAEGHGPAVYKSGQDYAQFWSSINDQIVTIESQIEITSAFAKMDPDLALAA